jgi:hypothetical protein
MNKAVPFHQEGLGGIDHVFQYRRYVYIINNLSLNSVGGK